MKRMEIITELVNCGLSIQEADEVVVTEDQFIKEIELQHKKETTKKEEFRKRIEYEFNRRQARVQEAVNPDKDYKPIKLSYEEAVEYDKFLRE
jgi:hypothetical protein